MFKHLATTAIFTLLSATTQAADLPVYPFVHVTGSGYVHVVPDRGEIDFDISAYDPDPAAAQAVVDARIAELRTLIEALGFDPAAISIGAVRREMRKSDGGEQKDPVYDLVCAVHIDVKDVTKWRQTMEPILGMKNLDHFSTSFSTVDRDKIESELTLQALKDARRRADVMASGVGKKVLAATAVSSGQLRNLTGAIGLQTSNSDTNTDPAPRNQQETRDLLMLTTLKMAQSVDVIYRLK